LYLVEHRFESFRVVHRKICQYFPVQLDIGFVKFAHEFGVGHAIGTASGINTLYPNAAEQSLFLFAVAVSVLQTFFNGVFGYRPYIFLSPKITFREL
jgi:hypothetical protein